MSNEKKPTKGDVKYLIKELEIDLKELDTPEVRLINSAMETEDPLQHIRDIAEQQRRRVEELENDAGDENETKDSSKVRRGDELVHQNQQNAPFCPYCSDPNEDRYVFTKADGTKGPVTYYKCHTKGCDFRVQRARTTVAKLYKKLNEMRKDPQVNARK